MPKLGAPNQCEACQIRPPAEDQMVTHLLERISELEDENYNLRKLEETIRRNSHLFDVLLRASHEAILLVNPELTILRLIHSALGYSENDLVGESLRAFTHPDDTHRLEDCLVDLLRDHAESCGIEIRALGPDGKWTWLAGHVTDLLDDPNVQAIVLNLRRVDKSSHPESPMAH